MTRVFSPGSFSRETNTEDRIHPAVAAELLQRATSLYAEAAAVVADLGIQEKLGGLADVYQLGSSVTGLMTWRDIDFTASCPGLTRDRLWTALHPVLTDPRLLQMSFRDVTGAHNPTQDPADERFYLAFQIETQPASVWKIDISFWLGDSKRHQVAESETLLQRLTDETRLAILWIKDIWRDKPEYPLKVGGTDIYRAVLDHGVRSPATFSAYLARTDQPPECAPSGSG